MPLQRHFVCLISPYYSLTFSCVLTLTLGRRHPSGAQGLRTPSWLRRPQAGSRPDWDIASAPGGGSRSPPALWGRPSRTSVSCSLSNSEKTFPFLVLYYFSTSLWSTFAPKWFLTLTEIWGTGQYHLIILTLLAPLSPIDACKPKGDIVAGKQKSRMKHSWRKVV